RRASARPAPVRRARASRMTTPESSARGRGDSCKRECERGAWSATSRHPGRSTARAGKPPTRRPPLNVETEKLRDRELETAPLFRLYVSLPLHLFVLSDRSYHGRRQSRPTPQRVPESGSWDRPTAPTG